MSSARVVQLIHSPRPFEDAVAAFTAARNAECIAILHHHTSPKAAFLQTRALIRLGRLNDAEKAIRSVQPRFDHFSDLAQCYTLLGTVLDRQGDYMSAADAFDDARAYAYSIPSVALHAELAFYEAQSAWRRRDFEQTERIALPALKEMPRPYDEPHSYSLEVSHAFLYELLSLIRAVHGQPRAQIDCLQFALQTLAQGAQRHVWAEASVLYNLATVVPELQYSKAVAVLREHAESLQWSTETAKWAYDVYRALGWSEALCGNYIAAFRDMRKALTLAPSTHWRIEAILDCAYLFNQTGQDLAAHERFDEADHFSKQIDWTGCDEERYVLLWFAEIAAQFDPKRASALLAQYKAIRKPMNAALIASIQNRRRQALEHDAYGAVAAANGAPGIALNHLRDAVDTWNDLNFEWRAAKTANAIARITNNTEDIADARRRAEPFAKSWLARTDKVSLGRP